MSNRRNPKLNRLLATLSEQPYAQLAADMELIALPRDCDIYRHSGKIDYIYFPISSIVSVVNMMEDGAAPEVATIGNDGVVGISAFMGSSTTTSHVVVQSAGYGYRIKTAQALKVFESDHEFRALILRYMQALFNQSAQTAACNRYHSIEQQVCRFLLNSLDRWSSNRISLTHQRIADLLGVRRAGVSEVSGKLARQGIIKYHRGCVTILERKGLERYVCECYKVTRVEMEEVLAA